MEQSINDIELPSSDEAAAHMLPSDLKKFEFGEHVAEAFSIAVGNPKETSQPLFTLNQVRAAIEPYAKRIAELEAALQPQDREDAIDMEIVAEQLRDMASSAYETAMAFGISQDSFERLAHQVFDHARRIEGDA